MKPRRWFRFSLRTFFVLVTVLGVLLGYHIDWIVNRRAFLRESRAVMEEPGDPRNYPFAPGLLPLLGERGVYSFHKKTWTPEEIERAASLFPEAAIVSYVPGNFLIYKFSYKKPHPEGQPVAPSGLATH